MLVFVAGFAGAGAASGGCGGWFTIRSRFCGFCFVFCYLAVDFIPVGGGFVHDAVEFLLDLLEEFGSKAGALLLEFFELVESSVEDAGGVGTGSFYGADLFFQRGVEERFKSGVFRYVAVGDVAAAKTPGGVGDLGGEAFFDSVAGVAGFFEADAEEFVEVEFFGEDEVVHRIESGGEVIA